MATNNKETVIKYLESKLGTEVFMSVEEYLNVQSIVFGGMSINEYVSQEDDKEFAWNYVMGTLRRIHNND